MYTKQEIQSIFQAVKTEQEWDKVIEAFSFLLKNNYIIWTDDEILFFRIVATTSLLNVP